VIAEDESSEVDDYFEKEPRGGGVVAGWVFVFILPFVGFLIGMALIAAGNRDGGRITAT